MVEAMAGVIYTNFLLDETVFEYVVTLSDNAVAILVKVVASESE